MRSDGLGGPFLKMDSPSARNGPQKTTRRGLEGLEFSYMAPLQNSDMKYNKYEVRNDRIANRRLRQAPPWPAPVVGRVPAIDWPRATEGRE